MKELSFETRLISATPTDSSMNHSFTDNVMRKIRIIQIATEPIQGTVAPKQSLITRLRHMPKLAVIVLVITALTLLSSTAYALYKTLWEQPKVTIQVPTTNQFGRTQVIASFENCGNQTTETAFEVKSGSTLDASEISKILQARCELAVIRDWSGENKPQSSVAQAPTEGTSQSSMTMVYPAASKVVSINDTSLSLTGDEHTSTGPLTLTKQTQYIVDGVPVARDQIHAGDSVLYVQTITTEQVTTKDESGHYNTSGMPTTRTITDIIKVNLPFEYYNPSKQNQIAQRQACIGNPQDSCVQAALVDVYASADAAAFNPDTNERRTIQGIVIEHDGKTIKVRSSSGRIFTLTTSFDIVSAFNQSKSANYNDTKLTAGNLLQVDYIMSKDGAGLTLGKLQITSVQLVLNVVQKGDSVQKY